MTAEPNALAAAIAIFGLTFFLDLLELSFARAVFFLRTLRFWLYFLLHFGISVLAAYLLHRQVGDWFLLAPISTLLGVGVLSNTNVKIAGYSLIPIADLFIGIRAKMFEQASEEKSAQVIRAEVFERLYRLPLGRIEAVHRAGLVGVGWSQERIDRNASRAKASADHRAALLTELIRANLPYVLKNLETWEHTP